MDYAFTWDPAKAAKNLAKHGVSFGSALQVFDDPAAVHIHDRIEDGEQRWQVIGTVACTEVLLVAYVSRGFEHNMEYIRIVSARPASHRERQVYEQQAG